VGSMTFGDLYGRRAFGRYPFMHQNDEGCMDLGAFVLDRIPIVLRVLAGSFRSPKTRTQVSTRGSYLSFPGVGAPRTIQGSIPGSPRIA
jgi:hypothetical protein